MTRRGRMPSGGVAYDDDRPKRRLQSLQPQIEAYSIKAWYTVPAARTFHGADPNAPREPMQLDTTQRLAARVVDELVGGNPANLGICDCHPCTCDVRASGRYVPCEHDLGCPHRGEEEDHEVVSAKLRALVALDPDLAQAWRRGGIESVYALADLTPAETQVARYKHEGLSHRSIAFLTNRQEGTVFALYSRAAYKLRELAKDPLKVAA